MALAAVPSPAQGRDISGTYRTAVSITRQTCPMQVMDNPTEVAQPSGPRSITLRHAGTTFGGRLDSLGRFALAPVVATLGAVRYTLVATGVIGQDTLDATVTITWPAAPPCEVVVRWRGVRQAPAPPTGPAPPPAPASAAGRSARRTTRCRAR
jgi:hypothetical protein